MSDSIVDVIHCMECLEDNVSAQNGGLMNVCRFCGSGQVWIRSYLVGEKHRHCLFVIDHKQVDA